MNIKAWYLYHSGFATKVGDRCLVFDYWKSAPRNGSFSDGVVDADEIKGKETFFFASHAHGDHYNPAIFNFAAPNVHYILSDDIPFRKDALMIGKFQKASYHGLEIETLDSTDQGVAFLVTVGGIAIYHAGDLNWWRWEDDTPEEEKQMKDWYFGSIGRLKGRKIDLAFIPVDPRLGKSAFAGIEAFNETVGAKFLAPMHFTHDPRVIDELMKRDIAKSHVIPFKSRGQQAEIFLEEDRFTFKDGSGKE
jgi:L-ascorbate metabolism protein UlaG (beta-lactamase superfamily)